MMHPCYAQRLEPFRIAPRHLYVSGTEECLRADHGALSLFLTINPQGSIVRASHRGGEGDVEAVLEAFCAYIEGRSLSDARSHGAIQLEYSLRSTSMPPPVPGLITPENADPAFAALLRLTHGIVKTDSSRSFSGKAIVPTSSRLTATIREELSLSGYPGPEVDVIPTGTPNRWLIAFPNGIAPADFFLRLLSLERRVRARTSADIELFLEGKEDRNQRNSRDPRTNDLHPGA